MKIRRLTVALDDLEGARAFYERQAEGMGSYFLDPLFSDIDSLLLYAGIHREVLGHHRLLAQRFPYAVYYKVNAGVVEVWRVLDCRRDPARIRRTLRQSSPG